MSDPTRATGEAARVVDLDAIERAAKAAIVLCDFPSQSDKCAIGIKAFAVLALVARVRSAEAERDAALARVKELEAGLQPFAKAGALTDGYRTKMRQKPLRDDAETMHPFVPKIGDLRTAARLLAGKDGADG